MSERPCVLCEPYSLDCEDDLSVHISRYHLLEYYPDHCKACGEKFGHPDLSTKSWCCDAPQVEHGERQSQADWFCNILSRISAAKMNGDLNARVVAAGKTLKKFKLDHARNIRIKSTGDDSLAILGVPLIPALQEAAKKSLSEKRQPKTRPSASKTPPPPVAPAPAPAEAVSQQQSQPPVVVQSKENTFDQSVEVLEKQTPKFCVFCEERLDASTDKRAHLMEHLNDEKYLGYFTEAEIMKIRQPDVDVSRWMIDSVLFDCLHEGCGAKLNSWKTLLEHYVQSANHLPCHLYKCMFKKCLKKKWEATLIADLEQHSFESGIHATAEMKYGLTFEPNDAQSAANKQAWIDVIGSLRRRYKMPFGVFAKSVYMGDDNCYKSEFWLEM